MSDYHSRYHISPQYDTVTSKSERSFPRAINRNTTKDDLSYKDLRKEYSKVISYVDSVRQDRSYHSTPHDTSTDRKVSSAKVTPSTDDKYTSGLYTSTSKSNVVRYLDSDKKIIELEQEVSELKKLLEANCSRISTMQRENQSYQDRLKEFKQIEQCNKQLGSEMKSLDHEIVNLTKKMKELETENARLLAEKDTINSRATVPKDFQKNLIKYGNYVEHLLSGMDKDHFSRFCFEERFTNEQDFIKLIDAKETDTLLIQAFRYIGDLLLNINSINKSGPTSAAISPKKSNVLDLNETHSSTPAARGVKNYGNSQDDLRGIRASYAQSIQLESSKVAREENSAKLSENSKTKVSQTHEEYKKPSSSVYQNRLRNEIAALHRERANERAAEKVDERLYRSNVETQSHQRRADSRSTERKGSQYEQTEERSQYKKDDSHYSSANERADDRVDERFYQSNVEVQPMAGRADSRSASRKGSKYDPREERSQNNREDNRYNEDERSYASKQKSQGDPKEGSRYVPREDDYNNQRKSSHVQERLTAPEVRNRQATPPMVIEYEDIVHKKRPQNLQADSKARRAATEAIEPHYYEDIPTFSNSAQMKSNPLAFKEDSSMGSRKSNCSPAPQNRNQGQVVKTQGYETPSDDQYQDHRSPQNLKSSGVSSKSRQNETLSQKSRPGESLSNSQLLNKQVSKRPSQASALSQSKAISGVASPKREPVLGASQHKSSASKQSKRPSNLEDPAEGLIPSRWDTEEEHGNQQQYMKPRTTPQAQEEDYDYGRPSHTEPNTASRNVIQKQQPSPKAYSEKNTKTGRRENRSKSPSAVQRPKMIVSVLDPKLKDSRIPSPISKQKPLPTQNSVKVLTQSPSQSQIVYKNQKSLQDSISPTTSNVSLRHENVARDTQPKIPEKELVQRGSQLVQRESELLQKIRELREKENELMEREREIEIQSAQLASKAQPVQKNRDTKSMSTPKELVSNLRTPKGDIRNAASPYREQRSNTRPKPRENSREHFADYVDEAGEPVEQRNLVKQASLSPRSVPDSERQMNIRPILKNSEARQDSGYSKYEPHNTSGFRKERQETNQHYDDENESRGRRSPYVQTSEDEAKRDQYYNQSRDRLAPVEGSHQKRLTFGTDTNFDQDLTSLQNESYYSEPRETPPPERKSSPQKADRGTVYPSFKVSFGKTESRFKRSMSPEPKVNSIMDVPKRKRVDHVDQTYDIIKGQDYENSKGDISAVYNSKELSQLAPSDALDIQKNLQDNDGSKAPENRRTL